MQRTRATHTRLAQINRHFTAPLHLKHVALRAKLQAILHVNTPTMSRDNDHKLGAREGGGGGGGSGGRHVGRTAVGVPKAILNARVMQRLVGGNKACG